MDGDKVNNHIDYEVVSARDSDYDFSVDTKDGGCDLSPGFGRAALISVTYKYHVPLYLLDISRLGIP